MTGELRLPAWANELRNRYLSGESSLFVLHGNVRDIHPWDEGNGKVEYLDLRRFLERFLARTRDIVAYYNVSQGLCFTDRVHERRFQTMIDAKRMLEGAEKLVSLPRTPAAAIPLIEELITTSTQSSGVILDYFEMVCPNGDVSFMSSEDRANLVAMQRWASEPAFVGTDNIAIIVTQSLSDVARRVVSSPQMSSVLVPYPDQESRLRFLEAQNLSQVRLELPLDQLAKVSAGLTLTQLQQLLRAAAQGGEPITFRAVAVRKKTIIEQECHGLVEFVAPDHDFSHVGGMEGVKGVLMRVAEAVKKGHRNRVPMGMIFVGPMGTGKTFIAEAFAGESGLTCLQFKNFREKWVGSTEGNLEKILDLVEALGYVLLIIDEADRSLSAGESDGGTSSRVIARLKEFMSDTSHRGRVVILMMTNRPDKLDTDLKRPGRFDLKIPFFFPEEAAQRESVLRAQVRKNKLLIAEGVDFTHTVGVTEGYSAAELEAVLLAAGNRAAIAERDQITQEDLDGAANDVVPSRDTRMLEYMEMLAVFESSSREMLPARYRHLSTDDVHAQLDLLRSVLGRRAEI